MIKQYHFHNIHKLLNNGFTTDQLTNLCYDQFKPVYNQLTTEMTKNELILQLIQHIKQEKQADTLLSWLARLNPERYKHHQPYYSARLDPSTLSDVPPPGITPSQTTISEAQTVITGGVSGGNVIIGDSNAQIGENHGYVISGDNSQYGRFTPSQSDATPMRQPFNSVKSRLIVMTSGDLQKQAFRQIDLLEQALTAETLDLAKAEQIQRWFVERVPGLFEAVMNLIFHSTVRHRVKDAGDEVVTEFKVRFGRNP